MPRDLQMELFHADFLQQTALLLSWLSLGENERNLPRVRLRIKKGAGAARKKEGKGEGTGFV